MLEASVPPTQITGLSDSGSVSKVMKLGDPTGEEHDGRGVEECTRGVDCKWGNSLAARIPKALADAIKVSDGKRAEIKVENGTLVLRPIVKPTRKSRYTLEELLSGMTRDNVPQEVDWGPRRGNEAW